MSCCPGLPSAGSWLWETEQHVGICSLTLFIRSVQAKLRSRQESKRRWKRASSVIFCTFRVPRHPGGISHTYFVSYLYWYRVITITLYIRNRTFQFKKHFHRNNVLWSPRTGRWHGVHWVIKDRIWRLINLDVETAVWPWAHYLPSVSSIYKNRDKNTYYEGLL